MVEMEYSAPSQAAIFVPNVSSLIEFSLGKGKHPCPPHGTFETKIAPARHGKGSISTILPEKRGLNSGPRDPRVTPE